MKRKIPDKNLFFIREYSSAKKIVIILKARLFFQVHKLHLSRSPLNYSAIFFTKWYEGNEKD